MSKRYTVTVPVTGYFVRDIVASSKREAIEKAVFALDGFNIFEPENRECLGEFEYHDEICTGNICHAVQNTAFAQLSPDQEDLEE